MPDIKLSIIIPYYQETQEELFPVLSVLNGQMGIDFHKIECLLVNDGAGNILPKDFLALFKNLSIRLLLPDENKGPGLARQLGIDNARGEYVMCCDADDSLSGVFVLNGFLDEIETNHPEVIFSSWLEEHYEEEAKTYRYSQHDVDFTWMHGKAFRRSFLAEKNIRFHEKLRIHEDNYFMALVFSEAEDIRKISAMTYVWKARTDSTTRRNNAAFVYETIPEFCESTGYVLAEIERRHIEQMPTCVTQGIINVYFILHRQEWRAESRQALLAKAETTFAAMIKPYLRYFEKMPDSVVASMYNKERPISFANEIETERLESWLNRIAR